VAEFLAFTAAAVEENYCMRMLVVPKRRYDEGRGIKLGRRHDGDGQSWVADG
jgi:hypothetical protein